MFNPFLTPTESIKSELSNYHIENTHTTASSLLHHHHQQQQQQHQQQQHNINRQNNHQFLPNCYTVNNPSSQMLLNNNCENFYLPSNTSVDDKSFN